MQWQVIATFSACLIGIYNTILEGNGKIFKSDLTAKLAHMMMILITAGIFAFGVFIYLYTTQDKSMGKALSVVKTDTWRIFVPAAIMITYMFLNLRALSEGGGVAMAVINLNVIIPILGGYFLYNDKIDATIIIMVTLITILTAYTSYHSSQINK